MPTPCRALPVQLDPRDLDHSFEGREHFKKIFAETDTNKFVVSLGDLGESKDCTGSGSLFAGTTECFELAADYLGGYGPDFDVVRSRSRLAAPMAPRARPPT